jgi:hypothetical protein
MLSGEMFTWKTKKGKEWEEKIKLANANAYCDTKNVSVTGAVSY